MTTTKDRSEPYSNVPSDSTALTIAGVFIESHKTALAKGWWESGSRNELEIIALMHTELSEAVEEVRKGNPVDLVWFDPDRSVEDGNGAVLPKPEGYLAEMADLLIRMGDTIEQKGLTEKFLHVLQLKLVYNRSRPYRHGGKSA